MSRLKSAESNSEERDIDDTEKVIGIIDSDELPGKSHFEALKQTESNGDDEIDILPLAEKGVNMHKEQRSDKYFFKIISEIEKGNTVKLCLKGTSVIRTTSIIRPQSSRHFSS